MADAETLSGIVFDDPPAGDNSLGDGDAIGPDGRDGSTSEMAEGKQPASTALESRLAELERVNSRYQEQQRGSREEVQRLLDQNKQLAQQNGEFLTAFRDLLKTAPTSSGATTAPELPLTPQRVNLGKAIEKAVVDGDYSEVNRLESELATLLATLTTRRDPPLSESLKPEQIQELVRTELSKSTSQQQTYQRMVTAIAQSHPFLADPKDSLYAEVWQAYDEAVKHPFMQEAYGDSGGRFTVDMPPPAGQGWGSKPMDMRILDRVALQVQAKHATANGRRQAEERRDAPTLDTTRRQPPSSRTPSMLFTKGEMANMQELLRLGIRGVKTMDEFKKYRWEKLIPAEEKQRRLETWRAGKWDA